MTILLPAGLPAAAALIGEGFDVRQGAPEAAHAGALRIALVNIMPDKPATELQIARMLAASGRDVALTLTVPDGYQPKTAPTAHMAAYYRPFAEVRAQRFDGVIITGAPLERMPFAEVSYWPGMRALFDWAAATAQSTWCICWAAMAALNHFHGTPHRLLPAKAFGIHRQRVERPDDPLMAGLAASFAVPVSRHAEVRRAELPGVEVLAAAAGADESRLCLLRDRANRMVLQFNHPEYDAETLALEYQRDRGRGQTMPANYFPAGQSWRIPEAHWRKAAIRLYANWLAEVAAKRDAAAAGPVAALLRRTGPAGLAELRVAPDTGAADGFRVNDVVEACARSGLSPLSVRAEDGTGLVTAIIAAVAEPEADRLVRRLLHGTDAARVSYRALDGSVGVMARRPGAAPADSLPTDGKAAA